METLWFCIVAAMIAVYVVLDGFDLGAGILHLFIARSDSERRTVLQSIGPLPLVLPVTNRVCILCLEEVGSGPGGTIYEIVDADCESCNELECRPGCEQSAGWYITVPGGLNSL